MRELVAHKADVTIPVYGTIADAEVYIKSEADKVIAELEETLKNSRNARKYWRNEYLIEYKECNHSNYKRCLAMAKTCQLRAERYERYLNEYKNCDSPSTRRWQFLMKNHYEKWHRRWLELAEKFNEEK